MVKMWIKLNKNHRIAHQDVYFCEEALLSTDDGILDSMRDVCRKLDVPAPVILPKHVNEMATFGRVVFKPGDFIESVDFDSMETEILREDKKKERDTFGVGY
ncbi:MAG: hypothetical protein KIG36_07495 [Eubacteriales bacterium]|nr:hypothetical protein [Eubacteriales bacterium]